MSRAIYPPSCRLASTIGGYDSVCSMPKCHITRFRPDVPRWLTHRISVGQQTSYPVSAESTLVLHSQVIGRLASLLARHGRMYPGDSPAGHQSVNKPYSHAWPDVPRWFTFRTSAEAQRCHARWTTVNTQRLQLPIYQSKGTRRLVNSCQGVQLRGVVSNSPIHLVSSSNRLVSIR